MIAPVVLRCRNYTELFPIRSLRPELALPLVKSISTSVADRPLNPRLFRRCMDRLPLHNLPLVQKSLMGLACIRHGPRCPSVGSDSMEYVPHG